MFQESSMLERTSGFVLEVLPYLLSALIAAVVVPGFLYSQAHGTKAAAIPNVPAGVENALEMIHRDHVAFASDHMVSVRVARPARDKLAYR